MLIVSIIAMLIIATFPFGGVLALGLPLSALAVTAILGASTLLIWNIGCAIENWLTADKPSIPPSDQPSYPRDLQKTLEKTPTNDSNNPYDSVLFPTLRHEKTTADPQNQGSSLPVPKLGSKKED